MTAPRAEWSGGPSARTEAGVGRGARFVVPIDPGSLVDLLRRKAWCLIERRLAWFETADREGNAFRSWCDDDPGAREAGARLEATNRLISANGQRVAALCAALGIDDGGRLLLELCVALSADSRLRDALGHLANLSGEPGLNERLLGQIVGQDPLLSGAVGTVVSWDIIDIAPGPDAAAVPFVDPFIVDYICGADGLDPFLAAFAAWIEPRPPLAEWPVAPVVKQATGVWQSGASLRFAVRGVAGSGRRTFCACVAAALNLGALAIDTAAVTEADWPRLYLRAQRFALLAGSALVWHGAYAGRRAPSVPGAAALQMIALNSDERFVDDALDGDVALPAPGAAERRRLWRTLLPSLQGSPSVDVDRLGDHFRLQVGDIAAIARRGATTVAAARAEARKVNREQLGDLGTQLECPFTRTDFLVPPELDRALDDFLFEAQARIRFWEQPAPRRLFPRGRGLIAFLVGPPGTGKTMAAQIVAAELGLDLYRIDIAACLSKYIGETVRNLRQVFGAAAKMNAVFLFDEADSLFAKRTEVKDAHDRYANTDTNYLLQLLEDFDGVALLASNRKQNIDPGFMRRIRFILEFPRPGPRERQVMWQRLVGELAGPEEQRALDRPVRTVADLIEMSGAQIKLALLSALFAAARDDKPLDLTHLVRGINRELSKEGRCVGPKERDQIERSARGGPA